MSVESRLNRIWYEGRAVPLWLSLLSGIFHFLVILRRAFYHLGILRRAHLDVPVIVVGNVTAGGTGKTPLTVAITNDLQRRGMRCGIVSRGHGGKPGKQPLAVTALTSTDEAGDEAVLLAQRTGAPVRIHPRRARAARQLLDEEPVDVIICDDGLQHYALARDIEIAVVDGMRALGNARLLPAGPLREPARRLERVDGVVVNGGDSRRVLDALGLSADGRAFAMRLEAASLVNLASGERRAPDALATQRCVAVAGIGNPQRFFGTLAELGYTAECRAFPDHHRFVSQDLEFAAGRPVLMTEKDAVKCRSFAGPDWWYVEVSAVLDAGLLERIADKLASLQAR